MDKFEQFGSVMKETRKAYEVSIVLKPGVVRVNQL